MTIIYPETENHEFTSLLNCKNSIFLAGPCPRINYDEDWRNEALNILRKLKFDGTVIIPTNKFYKTNDKNFLEKQTKWELEGLYKSSAIVFWIERSEEYPAFTTNIEFGNWYDKPGVFIGWTDKAIKNEYLEERLKIINKFRYKTL